MSGNRAPGELEERRRRKAEMDASRENGNESLPPLSPRALALRAALKPVETLEPRLTSTYLVKNWLDRGGASLVYGDSTVSKSFLALDIALHIAAGAWWHTARVRDADENGPVIYIVGEGSRGFENRCIAWLQVHPELREKVRGRFFLLTLPVDLHGSPDPAAIVQALEKFPRPSLVVIDTLARSMGSGDENTAQDMGKFMQGVDIIRGATGAHVLTIHHSGKDAARGARGSTSLRAAVDTEIEVTRIDGVIQAKTQKQREMIAGRVFAYRLRQVELGNDEDGDPVTSCVVEPCEAIAKKMKLTGAKLIAMQALDDAIAQSGVVRSGEGWPPCRVVPLRVWREFCDSHGLCGRDNEEGRRKAFARQRDSLHTSGLIRFYSDHVWKVPS